MQSLEVKQIGLISVFKFSFVVGVILGLIATVVLLLSGISIKQLGLETGVFSINGGPLQVGASLVGAIIASLAYGLIGGIVGLFIAFLYNVFASITGGIIIRVKEE
ncbi:MAG TPA: hypothetical protein PLZ08_08135 [Bacillota bacterium]|jgi:hypothetical protein|nr:hypothetical protein [Bacillota bacterium]HOL10151.1 hypothetical protein [Bacillota bacterium]HPO97914.1 hypothetical protein [Bacillota bacterium]